MLRNPSGKTFKIHSLKSQSVVAAHCVFARSFFARLRGLIGTKAWGESEGLLLDPCNDIHMWMMSIPIDVIFLRADPHLLSTSPTQDIGPKILEVTSLHEGLPPWKLFPVHDWSASQTLEVPVGTIRRCDLSVGDQLCIN